MTSQDEGKHEPGSFFDDAPMILYAISLVVGIIFMLYAMFVESSTVHSAQELGGAACCFLLAIALAVGTRTYHS